MNHVSLSLSVTHKHAQARTHTPTHPHSHTQRIRPPHLGSRMVAKENRRLDSMSLNLLLTASGSVFLDVFTPWSVSVVFSRRRGKALIDVITSAVDAVDELLAFVSSSKGSSTEIIFSNNFHSWAANMKGSSKSAA